MLSSPLTFRFPHCLLHLRIFSWFAVGFHKIIVYRLIVFGQLIVCLWCKNSLSQGGVKTRAFTWCHAKLKDMMERPDGGFDWSQTHNSPLGLSKLGLMNFPRSFRDATPTDLVLEKSNSDGFTSVCMVKTVTSHKYLGIIFDPKLWWTLQHVKVLTSATFWSSQVWCIAKVSNGLSIKDTWQLYNTASVPGFTYAAEVWYTGLHRPSGGGNMKGSVSITNKLKLMQHKVAIAITGALSSTAGDILDAHTNIVGIWQHSQYLLCWDSIIVITYCAKAFCNGLFYCLLNYYCPALTITIV